MQDVPQTTDQLRRLVAAHGITQSTLALATGASQSQVSRVLAGRTSMKSKLAKEISAYALACSRPEPRDRVLGNKDLLDAVAEAWDGTPRHAKALAAVIRSLSLLTSPADFRNGTRA